MFAINIIVEAWLYVPLYVCWMRWMLLEFVLYCLNPDVCDGNIVGMNVGFIVGFNIGSVVGISVGDIVGINDGSVVGIFVG